MKVINLTPHDIVVFKKNGERVVYEVSGQVARLTTDKVEVGMLDGVPVYAVKNGDVEQLPEPCEGYVYIVSGFVLGELSGKREDVIAPDTSPGSVLRDGEGKIVGVRGFVK